MTVLSPVKGPVANPPAGQSLREAVLAAAAKVSRRGTNGHPLGRAVLEVLRGGADATELGSVYEQLLGLEVRSDEGKPTFNRGQSRKAAGVYYTPRWLAELVLDFAVVPLLNGADHRRILEFRVLDPACGCGAFLVAAGDLLARRLATIWGGGRGALSEARREVATRCLHGVDRDPIAVALCRAAIESQFGASPKLGVIQGDGLLDEPPGGPEFDAVIGNPPFLNRLERLTEVDRCTATAFRNRFGSAARAYTDISALFLLRAVALTRRGGRVAMVQPVSLFGSRDAAGVRRSISEAGQLQEAWLAAERVFDASVEVCVPVIVVGERGDGEVRRTIGRGRVPLPPVALSGDSWAPIAATDVPLATIDGAGSVGDFADIVADFRDEYYGLIGSVVESRSSRMPRLITTGLIDIARCAWGERPCRFGGTTWTTPRVDIDRLDPDLRAWAARRLVPKLLLATQTRVLEVAADAEGRWLPVTPLISIVPRWGMSLWRIGAVLTSPVAAAAAARISAGTGLTRGVIKLSATQVRSLPMPRGELKKAADHFRTACRVPHRRESSLMACAEATCAAFGVRPGEASALLDWWRGRAFQLQPAT